MISFTNFMLLIMCAWSRCSNFFSFIAVLSSCYILNLYFDVRSILSYDSRKCLFSINLVLLISFVM